MIYQDPLAYLLGLEGVALLDAWAGDHDRAFTEARLAEIRRLLDDERLRGRGVLVEQVSAATVYEQVSAGYDAEAGGGLFATDEPVVAEYLASREAGVALDAACGTGRFAEFLDRRGHRVIGVDSSPDMLAHARRRVPRAGFRVAELDRLPLPDDCVDVIVCALAPALRWDPASRRLETIPTFAITALAGIGAMPDTIEDRAVVIRMRRRAPGEYVAPFRHKRDRPALTTLAADLAAWLDPHLAELERVEPAIPLEDRAADTWEPLIAVADLAGEHWPGLARTAAVALTADHDQAANVSDRIRLLTDCRRTRQCAASTRPRACRRTASEKLDRVFATATRIRPSLGAYNRTRFRTGE